MDVHRVGFILYTLTEAKYIQETASSVQVPGSHMGAPWNHRGLWTGKDLRDPLVPTPHALSRDNFH